MSSGSRPGLHQQSPQGGVGIPGARWSLLLFEETQGVLGAHLGSEVRAQPQGRAWGSREERPLDTSLRSLSSFVTFYLEEMFFKSQPPCGTQPACNLGIVLPTEPQYRNTIPESRIASRGCWCKPTHPSNFKRKKIIPHVKFQ